MILYGVVELNRKHTPQYSNTELTNTTLVKIARQKAVINSMPNRFPKLRYRPDFNIRIGLNFSDICLILW